MKLAIVHDWINNLSGAERVLVELHRLYPSAPIYTLFCDRAFARSLLPDAEIRTSFLQKIPFITRIYMGWAWLMPTAIESFDLSAFDTVISSSAIFSKGLVLKPATRHICYCYSPARLLWDRNADYKKGKVVRHLLRLWDRPAADRVDQFVAISHTVAARIKKYYGRDSVIVYPPVVQPYSVGAKDQPTGDYYLIASRLYDYKNIQIAVEAFRKASWQLIIIGDGPARAALQSRATDNIRFLGQVSDDTLAQYYAGCRAFIMPQEEDFGLTAVEAMSYGKPVVALRRGGATETVQEGVTGEFFDDPIPEALADALRRLNDNYPTYSPAATRRHAEKFSAAIFREKIRQIVEN